MDDVGVCGVEHHEVVVAGAFVLDKAEIWAFPEDTVVGGGVADGVEEVAGVEALPWGVACVVAHARDTHAAVSLVPHAELAGLLISPHGAVEGEASLPRVERVHDGVAGVLGGLVQRGSKCVGLVNDEVVYEELRGCADVDCHANGPPLGEQCAIREEWGKGKGEG